MKKLYVGNLSFSATEDDDSDISAMIQNLDGKEMDGRALRVDEAQDKPRDGGGGGRDRLQNVPRTGERCLAVCRRYTG